MGIEDRKKSKPCPVCHAPATPQTERTILRQLVIIVNGKKRLENETFIECACGNIKFGCITPIKDTAVIESEQ